MISKIKNRLLPLEEKGQSIIILAFSFIGLIALMGLALDLGLVYIERSSVKRAIDAAVLAGVTELSNEQEAAERALQYLDYNGYIREESNIYFKGCFQLPGTQVTNHDAYEAYETHYASDADAPNLFFIDTRSFQTLGTGACGDVDGDPATPPLLGDANKLAITGTVKVDINFFGLLGFNDVHVKDHAIAQNTDNLDIAIVLDRSGSMRYDPVCYGCWQRTESPNVNDKPRYSNYYTYPSNGRIYPLGLSNGFTHTTRIKTCNNPATGYNANEDLPGYTGTDLETSTIDDMVFMEGSNHNIIIEAELYSLNPAPIETDLRETGKGYWALQRGGASGATSIDGRTAYMGHHPILYKYSGSQFGEHYTLTDAKTGNAPWLEYDFSFPAGAGWTGVGNATIWAKVRGGGGDNSYYQDGCSDSSNNICQNRAYWAIAHQAASFDSLYTPSPSDIVNPDELSSSTSSWNWIKLGSVPINTSHYYRLYFFAGSTGYMVDRFIITDNNNEPNNATKNAPGTAGSATRAACDICNEIYAENITDVSMCNFFSLSEPQDNRLHPIWNDQRMPLRTTLEAIKFFITRLDAKRDQVGLVSYAGTSANKDSELACIRSATSSQNVQCVTGSNPVSFTTVLKEVEDISPGGSTPTWVGIRDGLEVLGIGAPDLNCDGSADSSCARGSAQKVLILLTDGEPNTVNWGGGCTTGNAPTWPDANDAYHRCPLYFAQQAAQNGVIVYTIALGYGVDRDWLKQVAELGNGQAYFSASGGDLDIIFSEILSNIYVRLIE